MTKYLKDAITGAIKTESEWYEMFQEAGTIEWFGFDMDDESAEANWKTGLLPIKMFMNPETRVLKSEDGWFEWNFAMGGTPFDFFRQMAQMIEV